MADVPIELGYAAERPTFGRRAGRWLPWFVLAACVTGFLGWAVRPAVQQIRLLALQRAALAHAAPDGHAVLDWRDMSSESGYGHRGSRWKPDVPTPWHAYAEAAAAGRPGLLVFVGRRTSPAGNERIVFIDLAVGSTTATTRQAMEASLTFTGYVVAPATLLSRPSRLGPGSAALPHRVPGATTCQVFAGRTDAADPSHLTIEIDAAGDRWVVDGWLRDDDTIRLRVRPAGATTRRSASGNPRAPGSRI